MQWAKRKSRKGRAIREMLMGIKKEQVEEGGRIETEGLIVGRVRRGEKRWRISGVYIDKGEMGRMLKELEGWIGTREEDVMTIVGKDFDPRIGREGG